MLCQNNALIQYWPPSGKEYQNGRKAALKLCVVFLQTVRARQKSGITVLVRTTKEVWLGLSLHSQAFPHLYSFCSRQMEMFQGRLKCLLFLRLLKKQQKLQMCFSGQVRVYTSIFDPINQTDWNTEVLSPSLGPQKTKYNVGVGQEINLATPEKCNFGNSPSGGPHC